MQSNVFGVKQIKFAQHLAYGPWREPLGLDHGTLKTDTLCGPESEQAHEVPRTISTALDTIARRLSRLRIENRWKRSLLTLYNSPMSSCGEAS